MSDQNRIDALKTEVQMLDGMIAEVEDQLAQVGQNLFKLRTVRSALAEVVDQQPELDFKEEEE